MDKLKRGWTLKRYELTEKHTEKPFTAQSKQKGREMRERVKLEAGLRRHTMSNNMNSKSKRKHRRGNNFKMCNKRIFFLS